MITKITIEPKIYRPFVKKYFPKVYSQIPARTIESIINKSKNNTEIKRKLKALEIRLY